MSDDVPHGGDVRGIARAAGRDPDDLLDFSANINPLGPPDGVRALVAAYAAGEWLARYPEPGLPELGAQFARVRGVEPANILVHAGSAALFDVILRARAPRRLAICLPAFAEYARAAAMNAVEVLPFALDAARSAPFDPDGFCAFVRSAEADAAVLTNPHNPLGFALPAATVRTVHARLPGVTLIVDEAFADYDERVSVARDAALDPELIVVRSITKFYAIPDLRVGYAVMTAANVRGMSRFLPAWPVSGIAAAAAGAAVRDDDYARTSLAFNARERARLRAALTDQGRRVLAASANFLTFAVEDAGRLRRRLLAAEGIVVRDCSSFGGLAANRYVRVAVRSAADNARLAAALARGYEKAPA